jgi:short-subunit dehydrogenase
MLIRTSTSPSVLLVSSAAAIIPAPTRALYAATKASSLLLFQALAIEQPRIAWTFLLPSTIEGNFRSSAVDGGPVREGDPNKHGFKIDYIAQKCIDSVDQGITGNIILPWFYTLGHFVYYLWPSVIERGASKKYNFTM